jgi:hypothetical protein
MGFVWTEGDKSKQDFTSHEKTITCLILPLKKKYTLMKTTVSKGETFLTIQ